MEGDEVCCQKFDPKIWDNKEVTWKNKLFVKATIYSFFHMPLNFGRVVKKTMKKIKDAKAMPKNPIMFSDEKSMFYSHLYISTTKALPGVHDVKVSGKFMTKVFEGPYKDIKKWTREMGEFVKGKGKEVKNMFYYYTTCHECAKKYGKNYVVLLAEI